MYTVVGAIIFWLIEGPNEEYELGKMKWEREKLLEVFDVKHALFNNINHH
jgi:hypothetical protein